jgi:hypothetical protein
VRNKKDPRVTSGAQKDSSEAASPGRATQAAWERVAPVLWTSDGFDMVHSGHQAQGSEKAVPGARPAPP